MSTHEHLEHAEHAEHAAHDPFDRKVAMTMAIVAAALACMRMMSHQAHNETLVQQNEAGRHQTLAGNHKTEIGNYLTNADTLKTEASIYQTKASDQWSFYQAKNIRRHEYDAYLLLSGFLAKAPGQDEAAKKAQDYWSSQVKKYEVELPKMKKEAEDLESKSRELMAKAKEEEKKVKDEENKAEGEEKQVRYHLDLSHMAHARSARLDLGELGIEMALVLCAIAVLTKRAAFWYSGMGIGVIGLIVGLSAFLMSRGTGHGDAHAPAGQHAPETPGKSKGDQGHH
jgi:hypothetical protein